MTRPTNVPLDAKRYSCRALVDGVHLAHAGVDVLNHERRRVAIELLREAGNGAVEVRLRTVVIQDPDYADLLDIERDVVRRGGAVITGWAVTG